MPTKSSALARRKKRDLFSSRSRDPSLQIIPIAERNVKVLHYVHAAATTLCVYPVAGSHSVLYIANLERRPRIHASAGHSPEPIAKGAIDDRSPPSVPSYLSSRPSHAILPIPLRLPARFVPRVPSPAIEGWVRHSAVHARRYSDMVPSLIGYL